MSFTRHLPVFKTEIIDYLKIKPNDLVLDLTLGDGGYTEAALDAGAKVISVDVDPESIKRATQFLSSKYTPHVIDHPQPVSDFNWLIINDNYSKVASYFQYLPLPDALIADLGISQYHIVSNRGFSFQEDSPLDMRLDQSLGVTAKDLVMALSESELSQLFALVEEPYHRKIAKAIVETRKVKPLVTTQDLASLVARVKRSPKAHIHPATKIFMALRMAVNLEREHLQKLLDQVDAISKPATILGFISFHSGEDHLIKHHFRKSSLKDKYRVINLKPIKPSLEEIQINPKIRSAKLRLYQAI